MWRGGKGGVDLGELLPADAFEFGGHQFDVLEDKEEAVWKKGVFAGLDKAIKDGVGLFEAPFGFCEGEVEDMESFFGFLPPKRRRIGGEGFGECVWWEGFDKKVLDKVEPLNQQVDVGLFAEGKRFGDLADFFGRGRVGELEEDVANAQKAGASEDTPQEVILLTTKGAFKGRVFVIDVAQGELFAALEDAEQIEEQTEGRGFAQLEDDFSMKQEGASERGDLLAVLAQGEGEAAPLVHPFALFVVVALVWTVALFGERDGDLGDEESGRRGVVGHLKPCVCDGGMGQLQRNPYVFARHESHLFHKQPFRRDQVVWSHVVGAV